MVFSSIASILDFCDLSLSDVQKIIESILKTGVDEKAKGEKQTPDPFGVPGESVNSGMSITNEDTATDGCRFVNDVLQDREKKRGPV